MIAAGPAHIIAWRPGRAEFVARQLSIPIFVEGLQCCGSVRDFVGVNDAIVIGVNRQHDRRQGRPVFIIVRRAGRPGAEIFIGRQHAIAVLVERFQRGARVGDFVRVNDPIVIRIQREHDQRRRRAMVARLAGTTRAAGRRAILVPGTLLCVYSAGRSKRQRR